MTRFLRDTLGLLLAGLIVITALHVGAARGQAQVAGSIVLCTGSGPVTVPVDADGQPVGHVTTCPDCVMSVLAGLDAPAVLILRVARTRRVHYGHVRIRCRPQALRIPPARGPPKLS